MLASVRAHPARTEKQIKVMKYFIVISLTPGHISYRTNLTKDQLEKAPKYNQSTSWNWNRDNDQRPT
jgi:hypothetical protein